MSGAVKKPLKVFVVAGEESGDALGGAVLSALATRTDLEVQGLGGAAIQAAGLKQSLFPMHELSIMGIAEVLPKIPAILKRIKQTALAAEAFQPDIILSVDAPDFCFRVQKLIRKRGLLPDAKQVHYGAPTVWAWRAGRAKKISKFLDGLICLLPFEPPYFEEHGLKAIAAGHPVVGSGALQADGLAGRSDIPLKHKKILGLLLGSRRGELKYTASVLCESARRLQVQYPDLQIQVPTLPHIEPQVRALLDQHGLKNYYIRTDKTKKWDVFASCDVALAVSGTVGLELCITGTPHLIAYKMAPFTFMIASKIVRTPFIHLGNIILNRPVIAEFIQTQCKAEEMAYVAEALLMDEDHRAELQSCFDEIATAIGANQARTPAVKAADFILGL
jgi:lipid-A-disaccharide synthase